MVDPIVCCPYCVQNAHRKPMMPRIDSLFFCNKSSSYESHPLTKILRRRGYHAFIQFYTV